MGNVLRYLKCCMLPIGDGPTDTPRYPNLKQVFLTSRIYGGDGNGREDGCLMPEPYAFESAFTIQRLIVAQIKQAGGLSSNDDYSGPVGYAYAPWFDWGPYLWASGPNFNAAGVNWCNGQNDPPRCSQNDRDFRDGDLERPVWWGDYIHPSANGADKVASELVKWIQDGLQSQAFISDWLTPWILP